MTPAGGGPIEGIKQISRIHEASGHRVEIISLDSPSDPWVKECPIKVNALGPGHGKFGYNSGFAPWLRRHACEYDAIVVSGIWQYNSLGVFRAVHSLPTPYYVFPHGMLDPWFKRTYPLKHLKKWLYWPWAGYRVLRDAKAVCFTCEEERRLARESFWLYRCNETVIVFGTAAPEGDPEAQKQLFFERHPETRGKRLILFLGRLHPKKGCDLLIRAISKVIKNNHASESSLQRLHLAIVGPDQAGLGIQLRALASSLGISDRITWTGMLPDLLKLGALRAAEIFVLPSHQENFGSAVVEALACGVPVLITNKVNIWREIEQDRAGLVGSDTEDGTYQCLAEWLGKSQEERESFRLRARACFDARFEIHRAAEGLISVLQSKVA